MKKTGGAHYQKNNTQLYFMAIGADDAKIFNNAKIAKNTLLPLNAITQNNLETIKNLPNLNLLIDSGIYNLANTISKKEKLTFTEALNINPERIPSFEAYYSNYIKTIKELEPHIWGYIELDIGGEKIKTKLRKQIEKDGLIPIPVWHPLIDGLNYLQQLLEEYDRICIGNLSYTSNNERMKILQTVFNIRNNIKNKTWIHALGMTPNTLLYTYPVESCDSSAWVSGIRFANLKVTGGAENFGTLSKKYLYNKQSKKHYEKAKLLANYETYFMELN